METGLLTAHKSLFITGFWPLFKKDMRYFMWPMIVLFLVINIGQTILSLGLVFSNPDLFYNLTQTMNESESLLITLFVRPILALGAMNYMYATLFLFTLITEHTSRSRDQLDMLPVRRTTQLTAKFCSLVAWLITLYTALFIFGALIVWIIEHLHHTTHSSPYFTVDNIIIVIVRHLNTILGILAVCAVGMLGFVTAISVKRLKLAAGTVVVFMGFALMSQYVEAAGAFIRRNVPHVSFNVGYMYDFSAAYEIMPYASVVLILVVASLVLFELFGES